MTNRTRWIVAAGVMALVAVLGVVAARLGSTGSEASQSTLTTSERSSVTTTDSPEPTTTTTTEASREIVLPADVVLDLSGQTPVSAEIGSSGGTMEVVSASGVTYTLEIPERALFSNETITMTPITALGGPSDVAFIAGVHLEPSGLTFLQSLTLTIDLGDPVDPSLWAWRYEEDGEGLHPVRFAAEGSSIKLDVWHFSGAGVSVSWEDVVSNVGDFAASAAEQIAEFAWQWTLFTCSDEETCFAEKYLDFIDIQRNWYISGVKPLLENAKTNPSMATEALSQWAKWLGAMALAGSIDWSPLDSLVEEAGGLAIDVAQAAFDAAVVKCDGRGSRQEALADLAEPFGWISKMGLVAALAKPDEESPLEPSDLDQCAVIRIVNSSSPSHLDSGTAGDLKIQAGVRFRGSGGITRYDLDVHVRFQNLDGVTASPSSDTPNDQGWAETELTMQGSDEATARAVAVWSVSSLEFKTSKSFTIKPKTALQLLGTPASGGTLAEEVTVEPGTKVRVEARVSIQAEPANNKTVVFTLVGPGELTPAAEGQTDADGLVVLEFLAPIEPGETKIIATHTPDGGDPLTDEMTITYGGQFSEGYFFGRPMHECEWNPDFDVGDGHTCSGEVAEITAHPPTSTQYRAWIHVHDKGGEMAMDLYWQRMDACGWKWWELGYQTCSLDVGDEWKWRAYWIWQQRTITDVGPTSVVAEVPRFNHPNHVLCYIECLSPPSLNLATFSSGEMRLLFGVDKVILVEASGDRWVFTKHSGGGFNPFGTWAFHPDSLETPDEFRAYNP